MKRWIALLLMAVMIFGLAACGEKKETGPESESYTEEPEPETRPGALPVVTYGNRYSVTYDRAGADDGDLPVLDGFGMDQADGTVPIANTSVSVWDREGDYEFDFILRAVTDANYADDGSTIPEVYVSGYLGDRLLLCVYAYDNGNEAYYFLNTSTNELTSLGVWSLHRFAGNYMLFGEAYDGEHSMGKYFILDWDGRQCASYPDVLEVDREPESEDIYFIAGQPQALLRVPGDAFYAEDPDFTAEKLCEFGSYTAVFSVSDYAKLCLTRGDGGHWFTCAAQEAAEVLGQLAAEPAQGSPAKEEKNDDFAVTVPGFFTDRYRCEAGDGALTFYLTMTGGANVQLFSFRLVTAEEAADFLTGWAFVKEYVRGGVRSLIAVQAYEPTVDFSDGEDEDLFTAMLMRIDDIAASLRPVPGDASIREIDFSGSVGMYTSKTVGASLTLKLTTAQGNVLTGELIRAAGGKTEKAGVSVVMLGDTGYFVISLTDGTTLGGSILLSGGDITIRMSADNDWLGLSDVKFSRQ